jgi:dolichol-phosphate mannosyltransferase
MKVSIVVPAHNEEENLPSLMESLIKLRSKLPEAEIVLVDDHSTDNTPQMVDGFAKKHKFVKALHRRNGIRGMGNTLKEGTRAASGEIVVWTMADLSDDPEVIPVFLKKIEDGADMVLGSRRVKGGSTGDQPFLKSFFSRGFAFASWLVVGVKVQEVTNAFRAFRKEVFDKIPLKYGDFGISPEFTLKAHIAGYKLDEVPVNYADRKKGVAQFKIRKMSTRYFGIFLSSIWWRIRGVTA